MSIKKLTSVIRRGSMLAAVFAIVAATFAPAASTFADALNPLTERSLTLSSSSPGWDFKDGSGNSTYAPPNSGANGQKTGNTFAFKVSSDTATGNTLKSMTFQYCTKSAGLCQAPGNLSGSHTNGSAEAIAAKESNLDVVLDPSASEVDSAAFGTYVNATTNGTNVAGEVKAIPSASGTGSNFVVYSQTAGASTPTTADDTWAYSAGWTIAATNAEDEDDLVTPTGANNKITLTNTAGTGFAAGTPVKVVFFATDSNYITNPGQGAFFVKINTYRADNSIVDGGVTVANVMNQSISIQTKVLETMDFSVGTVDPNTLSTAQLTAATASDENQVTSPQVCGRILKGMTSSDAVNTLKLGNQTGENSLETDHTYSSHSYWRLSSNSSAGATVYYSGNTLSNTVNDKIKAIGAEKAAPAAGGEQFGLALANGDGANGTGPTTVGNKTTGYKVNYSTEAFNANKLYEYGADDSAAGLAALRADQATNKADLSAVTATGVSADMLGSGAHSNLSYHDPQLYPLVPAANYDDGAGTVNAGYNNGDSNAQQIDTAFAFDETSQQIPVAIASQDSQVVDCVTGKMRYIANIAATTPAGIYTTKINYIAAPQY